jgi:hypothetical protein
MTTPAKPPGPSNGSGNNYLKIDNLHLHANDIDALRRLAETDPHLARDLLKTREAADRRENISIIVAMVATTTLAVFGLAAGTYVLVTLGVVQSLIFAAVLLGLSHLVRVILTGEWSDTSWFGKLISGKRENNPEG